MFPNILTVIVVAWIIYILGVKSSPYADYMGSPTSDSVTDDSADTEDEEEDEGASVDDAEEDAGEESSNETD